MEDFRSVYEERHKDFMTLDEKNRHTAAMHLGGVSIECLLKSIIKASLPVNALGEKEWKTETNNPGHTVHNPGHSYTAALRVLNHINYRAQKIKVVSKWLQDVEKPSCSFIDMRYIGNEPDDEKYKQWKASYTSLKRWLEKQATQ